MKTIFSSLIVLFLILFLGACTQKDLDSNASKFQSDGALGFGADGRRMPDFGQPEAEPDFRGLVTSVIGNEVSVLKVDRFQMGRGENGDVGVAGTGEERQARAITGDAGGRMPGMGPGMGAGRGGAGAGITEDSQAAMFERIKSMSTGEEKITIPIGIPMLKPDTAATGQPNMIEATFSDIKNNSMITVWLDEAAEGKAASFVMISR